MPLTQILLVKGVGGTEVSLEPTGSRLSLAQNNLNTTEIHLGVTCSEPLQFLPLKLPEKYHIQEVGLIEIVPYLIKPVSGLSIGQIS